MHPTCAKCGQVHQRCAAHRKSDGHPCGRSPRKGERLCRQCGGNAPQVRRAAQERIALAAAEEAVRTYGLALDISPTEALLDEVKWTAGHVAWLRLQVQELERKALVWGKTEEVDKGAGEFTGVDTTHAAVPNVWLELYRAERKHLVDVCATAIRCGIEERRVRLAEREGDLLAGVIRAVLNDAELALSPEQQTRAPAIVVRHLRAVAA